MPGYVLPGLWPDRVRVIPPAIDPLSPKNRPRAPAEIDATLARLGVDPRRPLATQVSRFDSWKNPWQAVEAYRLARRAIPGLQLALLGVFSATDDPEAPRVYRSVRRLVGRDPDVHLFTDPGLIGPREVNAFQAGSAVVLQRSVREGFGLTVSEAMWKARPVVATPVGGITIQIRDGQSGFLVTGTEACAERMVRLARDPALAAAVGRAARRTVRDHFLLPRLLRDDLLLYGELVASEALSA
jgi:trehalose synthase